MAQVVEHLPSRYKAPSSNPSILKKKKSSWCYHRHWPGISLIKPYQTHGVTTLDPVCDLQPFEAGSFYLLLFRLATSRGASHSMLQSPSFLRPSNFDFLGMWSLQQLSTVTWTWPLWGGHDQHKLPSCSLPLSYMLFVLALHHFSSYSFFSLRWCLLVLFNLMYKGVLRRFSF
jgi:hypothetical protein